jgi:glycosyltransferase involved in cell wall biosynthesis
VRSARAYPPNSLNAVRLLGLTNFYPPLGYGYGAICADVMEELGRRGHQATVLCAEGGPGRGILVVPGLGHAPAAWRRPVTGLRAEIRSQRLVREALADGVDAALVWHMRGIGKGSLTLLHEAGIPVVYMLGDLWVVYERPGPPSLWSLWSGLDRRPFYRRLRAGVARAGLIAGLELRQPAIADRGICVFASEWLRRRYAQEGFVPARGRVVPNGLRPELFAGGQQLHDGPPQLLFAGRTDASKGADVAIRALAAIPDAQLLLVGGAEPDVVAGLHALAAQLGLSERVHLLGPRRREEVAELLAQADVMVMPGRIEEAFGLVYLEAMAAGVPVVGTATGGASEFCVDGENMLVTSTDPSEVAAAVRRVLADDALRASIVAGGQHTAEQHSLARMVDALAELLATVGPV